MSEKRCARCGEVKPTTLEFFPWRKTRFDSWCRECYRERSRLYLATHPDHRRSRDAAYRERNRKFLREYGLKYGREYSKRDVIKERRQKKHQQDKLDALNAYGGPLCKCCGESNVAFLTLDHINNDGAEHRRQLGMKGRHLAAYAWAKRNGYPPIFQVLCYNCNCARAHDKDGTCPHELERQRLFRTVKAA